MCRVLPTCSRLGGTPQRYPTEKSREHHAADRTARRSTRPPAGPERSEQPWNGSAGTVQAPQYGLVVDLGPRFAVANPLGINLSGLPAKIVTRLYHLYALPRTANRFAVAAAYLLEMVAPPARSSRSAWPALKRPALRRKTYSDTSVSAYYQAVRKPRARSAGPLGRMLPV